MNKPSKRLIRYRIWQGMDPAKAASTPPLSPSARGTRAARKELATKPFVINPWKPQSPEFVPGKRKPRADRRRSK